MKATVILSQLKCDFRTYNGCHDNKAVARYIYNQFSCYDDDSSAKTTNYGTWFTYYRKR